MQTLPVQNPKIQGSKRDFLHFLKFRKGFSKTTRVSILTQASEISAHAEQSVTKLEIQNSKCLSAV